MTYFTSTLPTGHKTLEGEEVSIDQIIDDSTTKKKETYTMPQPGVHGLPNPLTVPADEVEVLFPVPSDEVDITYEVHEEMSPIPGPSSRSMPYVAPEPKRPRLEPTPEHQKENIPPTIGKI